MNDRIAVVIPTVGRPSLRESIQSVRDQTLPANHVQVIAVFDTPEPPSGALAKMADTTLWTGGGRGGGAARQLGVDSCDAEWVAFLDDDDSWAADKLRLQLTAAQQHPERPTAVGCRLRESTDPAMSNIATPARRCRVDESISDYLFVRRGPTVRRNGIPTSTLLVDATTARELVRWDPKLSRHQDWDWLVKFDQVPNRRFVHLPEVLVQKTMGTEASISANADWRASLAWYDASSARWSRRSRADFLIAQGLRYALQARSMAGVWAVVRRTCINRQLPSLPSIALGLVGLIPRRSAQSVFGIAANRKTMFKKGRDS
ncbi:glycosyltransferase [Aeromicrobium wangtongii]|uniref:glycosyltransferase n=1 Tax=Aeromicrobium wangtongii TaxID=2969247 RepID=UPI0034E1B591